MKQFRWRIVIAILAIVFVIAGCGSDENEASELELGIVALVSENESEAKEHFADVSEEDEAQAQAYIELIESAEEILKALEEDDIETAVDTYQGIEEDDAFSLVTFIFADEEEKLTEVLDEREQIDEKIHALLAFFDPDDPEMSANELYLLKSDDLLDETHITNDQTDAINEFQASVQEIIDARTQGSENRPDKEEVEEETDEPGKEEEQGQEGQKEQDGDGEQESGSASDTLTHDEAKDAVFIYLYGEAGGDSSEDSNFKLQYDHDDGDAYVFHYYEVVDHGDGEGHTATIGWYAVDSKTGEVTDIME